MAAAPFAVATVGLLAGPLATGEVPIAALFVAPLFGVCAVGLWLVRTWGRSIALVIAIGHGGLATLGVISVMVEGGPVVGPALLLAASVGIAYGLSRPVFTLPEEE